MIAFAASNLVLRFALELAALGAIGAWGWHTGGPLLGLAAPVIAAVLWGSFAAPKTDAPLAANVATQILVLGGAALAFAALRSPMTGGAFAAVALANAALLLVLDR